MAVGKRTAGALNRIRRGLLRGASLMVLSALSLAPAQATPDPILDDLTEVAEARVVFRHFL